MNITSAIVGIHHTDDPRITSRDLDHFRIDERLFIPDESASSAHARGKRIAIIGAGPAGLSAANILAQLGYQVTLFDTLPIVGGMLAVGIPVDRRPGILVKWLTEIVHRPGIEVQLNTAIGHDLSFQHLRNTYDAILLAVGTQHSVFCGIPGEAFLQGVLPALQFLRHYHLSPHFSVKGEVAVIGAGIATMDAARLAKRAGAHSVQVFLPEQLIDVPARKEEFDAARAEGVEFHPAEMPRSLLGTEDTFVHGMRCQRTWWNVPPTSQASPATNVQQWKYFLATNRWYSIDIVLLACGEQPDLSFVPDIPLVFRQVRPWGSEATCFTTLPGVCIAGDAVSASLSQRTLLHALTGGYKAAHAMHQYLCDQASSARQILPTGAGVRGLL